MSSLPDSTVLGILKSCESQDAEEFSKCQRSVRTLYKRNRKLLVYQLNINQPILNEDKYILTTWNGVLQFPSKFYSLNMDELKNELLEFAPAWVKFEISDRVTAELLDFLPEEWLKSVKYIDIRCLKTDQFNLEATKVMKSKITSLLCRFGTIDNIKFKPREISTSGHDHMQYLCWWIRRRKIQTRGLRMKYEQLNITQNDVGEILRTSNLSKHCHLWLDWRWSSRDLGVEIKEYLSTIQPDLERRKVYLNNKRIIPIQHYGWFDITVKYLFIYWIIYLLNAIFDYSEYTLKHIKDITFEHCFVYILISLLITILPFIE